MSIESFRAALATCLDGVDGLRCQPYMTDQIHPPQAMLDWEVNYDLTFARGADVTTWHVMVFDQRKSERAAQIRLDTWRDGTSASSLKSIIEASTTVDAACDYCRVVSASRPSVVTVGTVDYLMIDLTLEVVL